MTPAPILPFPSLCHSWGTNNKTTPEVAEVLTSPVTPVVIDLVSVVSENSGLAFHALKQPLLEGQEESHRKKRGPWVLCLGS